MRGEAGAPARQLRHRRPACSGGPLATARADVALVGGALEPDSRRRAVAPPPAAELGRRYVELLAENLGQPGFRELLVAVHDMDARRDVVFALLAPARSCRASSPVRDRTGRGGRAEAFDLAGVAREHVIDALAGASRCRSRPIRTC